MKVLTAAALLVALAPLAHAANVNCERPLTSTEYKLVAMGSTYYSAYSQQINAAMTDFCRRGKQSRAAGEPGQQTLARIDIESRRWVNQNFGRDGMTQKEFDGLADLLAGSGARGYTNQMPDEPAPMTQQEAAKRKAAAAAGVDDLFGDLSSGKNAAKPQKATSPAPKSSHAGEINQYAHQVSAAIQSSVIQDEAYKGKMCTLRLNLARSGEVNSVNAEGGDPELCQAMIEAVKKARIPAAPSDETYESFKNFPIDFRP